MKLALFNKVTSTRIMSRMAGIEIQRIEAFGVGRDWDESNSPYKVAKAMFYLEGKDIALAVLPRSHQIAVPPTENWGDFSTYQVLPKENVLDVPLYDDGDVQPILIEGGPGDLLVFDIRILHGGRVLDPVYAQLHQELAHPKSQVAIVYGANNIHSQRFYSYTRFVRDDMGYATYRQAICNFWKVTRYC